MAKELLQEAEHALTNNPAYDVNYKSKGFARLAYLQSNLAALRGQFVDAQEWQEIAIAFRQNVDEPPAKQEKFKDKFINLETATQELGASGYINPSRLFRPKPATTAQAENNATYTVTKTLSL